MHVLITQRPRDESTRSFVPGGVPKTTRANSKRGASPEKKRYEPFPHERRARKLVTKVKQKVIHGNGPAALLRPPRPAHVQLLAKFHGKVVAKTAALTLGKGPHRLRLKLDPKRWPTGLDFQVHPSGRSRRNRREQDGVVRAGRRRCPRLLCLFALALRRLRRGDRPAAPAPKVAGHWSPNRC